MELDRYIDTLQRQLSRTADAGGDEARALADRLVPALDSSLRLALLEALSDAAAEITTALAPGSVDVRLRGGAPEFVVMAPPLPDAAPVPVAIAVAPAVEAEGDEGTTSRTTLRLPESLKLQVETAAAREGLSVNSWLVRAVSAALAGQHRPAETVSIAVTGDRFSGWVR